MTPLLPRPSGAAGVLSVLALVVSLSGCSSPPPKAPSAAGLPPTPTPSTGPVLPRWESAEAARATAPRDDRLTPGDVIEISVAGHEDMKKELPVRPDGQVSYIFVGDVPAGGRTVPELREDLETRLKTYMRYPQVAVVVRKAREAQFAILGKVVRPGVYPLNGPTNVVAAISLAQGLASGQYEGSTIEIADLANSFLVRRNRVMPVDFERLIHRGDTTQDVLLEDGDYIYVPSSLAQEVYVLGEVYKPRAYGFRGRVTLMQAISESGGFKSSARLGDVVILRGQYGNKTLVPVNVKDILAGKTPDPELAVGDVVWVPRTVLANLAEALNQIMPALLAYQLGKSF
jgi:protein involved in polysaccharide export with SLBB domain